MKSYNLSAMALLVVALAIMVASNSVSAKKIIHYGMIGDGYERFKVDYEIADKPLSKAITTAVSGWITEFTRIVARYLDQVSSPGFTKTPMAINKTTTHFTEEMRSAGFRVRETTTYKNNPELQRRISKVVNFFYNAVYKAEKEKLNKKINRGMIFSASEASHIGQLLEEVFNKTPSDWLFDIESIDIYDVPLEKIVQIYLQLLKRDGLEFTFYGFQLGLTMTFLK